MTKKLNLIVLVISIIVVGSAAYLLYIKYENESKIIAELSKPYGHIGFENKSNKPSEIKITNSNNPLVNWVAFKPGGIFSSYGAYEAGFIKLELVRNDKVIHSLEFELKNGGDVTFNVYENEIKPK